MDIRIEKTEKAIRDAFIEQRIRRPLEKIRVKELCEAAHINKSTFYTHYQDVYALSDALEARLIEDILARLTPVRVDDLRARPEWLTRELLRAFNDNREQVQALFSGSRQGLLIDRIESGLRRLIAHEAPGYWDDPVRSILLSFCVQGCYYAFNSNSGRIDEETLVRVLGAVSKAAQNIRPGLAQQSETERAGEQP